MANLFNIIGRYFKKPEAKDLLPTEPDEATTRLSKGDLHDRLFYTSALWGVDYTRKDEWHDLENMYRNDEIVAQAVNTLVETALGMEDEDTGQFYLSSRSPDVKKIADSMLLRTDFKKEAPNILIQMILHGDEFRELVYTKLEDGYYGIVGILGDLPSYQIYANYNDDLVLDNQYPWEQRTSGFPNNKIKFKAWQLAQFSYGRKQKRITEPVLSAARRNWKRLQLLEDNMAHARIIRAYNKLVHKVPVNEGATSFSIAKAIAVYKRAMEKIEFLNWQSGKNSHINNPLSVGTDFYIPDDGSGRGGIEAIDPKNSNLQAIDDVLYARERLISILGVPSRYLNIEGRQSGAMNQGGGDQEEKHYARKIRRIQEAFKDGLRFIIDMELIMHGLDPSQPENSYVIHMNKINSDDAYRSAQAFNTRADAFKKFTEMAEIPDELLKSRGLQLTDKEMEQFGEKIKFRTKPNPALGGNQGGAPEGMRPGSNGPNGSVPGKQYRNK